MEKHLAFCLGLQRVMAGDIGRSRNQGRFLSVTEADCLPKMHWRLTELHRDGFLKEIEIHISAQAKEIENPGKNVHIKIVCCRFGSAAFGIDKRRDIRFGVVSRLEVRATCSVYYRASVPTTYTVGY
jgi:hypothetical protein